jgi:hypothetical protein
MGLDGLGRMLMWLGGGLLALGLLLVLIARIPGLGHFPGDIVVHNKNFTLYAPFGLMVVLSIMLTVILNLIARWRR